MVELTHWDGRRTGRHRSRFLLTGPLFASVMPGREVGNRCGVFLVGVLCCALFVTGCRMCGLPPSCPYVEVEGMVADSATMASAEAAVMPPPPEPFWSQPQPLKQFVARALEQNPAIHAARYRIEVAESRVPQVATWPDPMLSVTAWPFFPFVPQTGAGVMTVDVMVGQRVPWKGKLIAQASAAMEEVQAARAQLAAVELETIEQVKRWYYELEYLQRARRVLEQDRQSLTTLIDVATARYQVNLIAQQELLRLQAELSLLDSELVRLQQETAAARAQLARLLHLSPDTPFVVEEDDVAWTLPADLDALYRRAVAVRPELQVQLAELYKNRHLVDLARLEYYPDPEFRVGWTEMTTRRALAPFADGLDMVSIGVAVDLPVNRARRAGAVREAESQVVAAARQYDQLRDQTLQEVKHLFSLASSQREVGELLRQSVIPNTEAAYQSVARGYQTGLVAFADVLAAWRELLRYHLMLVRVEAQFRQAVVALEKVVGGLEPATTGEQPPTPPGEEQ